MIDTRFDDRTFREGDEVVLARGTYPGTSGVFLRLRPDVNWADITERSGAIRSHPGAMAGPLRERRPGFPELRRS